MEAANVEIPSRRFGKYRVRSRLGVGGMAEVFLAEAIDEKGERLSVAMKLMKAGISEEAFAAEADLMGMLSHPNLVKRLELGEAFGRPYIAMEALVGGDLREVMDAHQQQAIEFPLGMALHLSIEVLKALAYFHQAKTRTGTPLGLVHGDVNPANIIFSATGEVKLGDFGVATGHHGAIGTLDGGAAGKLQYLSPEQTRGERLGPQSDLFSLGVMLHELVVGTHPFIAKESDDPEAAMAAIRSGKLALPARLDKALAQVLGKALAPELKARYRTAGELAGDLFRYTLDRGLSLTSADVQGWLERVLAVMPEG